MLNPDQRNWCLCQIIDRLDDQEIVQISAGRQNTAYLTGGGNVYIMGKFGMYYTEDDSVVMEIPLMIQGLPNDAEIIQISNGYDHVLMLDKNGRVYVYGSNYFGQAGLGASKEFNERAVEITSFRHGTKISFIAANDHHSFFVDTSGNVYCSGYGSEIGVYPDRVPRLVADSVCRVSPNWHHVLFLNSEGTAYGCGEHLQGCLSQSHRKKIKSRHTKTFLIMNICQISAGWSHSLFLSNDGKVYGMGSIGGGQLANSKPEGWDQHFETDILSPVLLDYFPAGVKICKIAAARNASFFLTEQGDVYVCGDNDEGQIGLGDVRKQFLPARIEGFPAGTEICDIVAGYDHTIFIARNGEKYCCGSNLNSQFGCGDSLEKKVFTTVTQIKWKPPVSFLLEEARQAVERARQTQAESTILQRERMFTIEQVHPANNDNNSPDQKPDSSLQ
jgi:alpha-tubulin suppressor-like RCC1 family protein